MGKYQESYTQSSAVVVGINQYADPRFVPLGEAEADARALADALAAPAYNFSVELLLGEQATRTAIIEAISQLRAAQPDDRIIFYFAGHGYTLPDTLDNEVGYLACSDTVPDNPYAGLEFEEVTKICRWTKAKHIAFILDACFSGKALGLTRAAVPTAATGAYMQRRAWQVLTAGGDEVVSDAHSMTDILITVLKEGIPGETGPLTFSHLGGYVKDTMSSRSKGRQIPVCQYLEGSSNGEMVLLTPSPFEALPESLRQDLRDDHHRVRFLAVGELQSLVANPEHQTAAEQALEKLAVDDPDPDVRRRAFEILRSTQLASPEPVETNDASPAPPQTSSPPAAEPAGQSVVDDFSGASMSLEPGQQFGQYLLLETISRSGMSVVYKARQTVLGRPVAVRIFPAYFLQDSNFGARFEQQIAQLARLQHPRIVPVYDFGILDNRPYITMAYLHGGTLATWIRQGPIELKKVVAVVDEVAAALDYAHQNGMLHRDLKPTHVLFDEKEHAYVANFGLMRVIASTARLTGGSIVGTPAYLAPELAAEAVEPSTAGDIYALGVLTYQMITGELPFRVDTPMALMMAHISQKVPDIRELRPDAPAQLNDVIRQGMAKEPESRFETAGEFADALKTAVGR